MRGLNGKTVIVTGGGGGIGRAVCQRFAGEGSLVAVLDRDENAARATADLITEAGGTARAYAADITDYAAITETVAAIESDLGVPTVLVNNASIFEYDTIQTATRTGWDRHMESNLRAPYVLIQALAAQAPKAVADAAGEPVAQALAVNMIDQRVRKLTPEFSTYTLAKMGLWALTRTAAQGLAPEVRVNAIGPGPTLRGARQSPEHFDRQRAGTVLNRGADPADITAALGYLLEAKAVTGQLICVDGGQHLGWQTPDILGVE